MLHKQCGEDSTTTTTTINARPATDELVDFVEQKDGVASADVLQAVNDASRH